MPSMIRFEVSPYCILKVGVAPEPTPSRPCKPHSEGAPSQHYLCPLPHFWYLEKCLDVLSSDYSAGRLNISRGFKPNIPLSAREELDSVFEN